MSIVHQSLKSPDAESLEAKQSVPKRLWNDALHHPADQFLSRCGKRIRAAMVHESFRLAGGDGDAPGQIVDAIELLHAGSLIIDDIEDDSVERRGQPTLHREIGMPLALNTGNWMYFRSLEKLGDAGCDPSSSHQILIKVIRTVRRCHEGQALDLAASVDLLQPSEIRPTVLAISRLKTGGLTALSSWLGATAANDGRMVRKALWRFGMNVGVCLQMRNDLNELRGLFNCEERFDDLRNARVTWPWAWAAKIMSKTEFNKLQHQLRNAINGEEDFRWVARKLIDAVGKRGNLYINAKLKQELTLLGEHVDSTKPMRIALAKLHESR
ncbi:MAG: polyprenyl synthetase family protein [Planctomycetota bacterium]|nr:polyprenyl synthetase family protein [Planctomycetota bacterium]